MAKKQEPNPYDKRHVQHLAAYERAIDRIYKEAVQEGVLLSGTAGKIDTSKPFTFDDYPNTRKRIERLISKLKRDVQLVILNGIKAEWTLANNKNNEMANVVFGAAVGNLTDEQYKRYYSNNEDARKAFAARKERGLDLSQRVWNYGEQFKTELEMGLDIGLRDGRSADELSRDIRSYLKHPDKLFRRVRDAHGRLHLSKAAKAFHSGRGVYRSSYKNARRLAVTETNMAYRTADYLRWQQMDFVVGVRISLSNNHTLNGVPFTDICDELQGAYPKDFKFVGWHPHCRCFATPIRKTHEEIQQATQRILQGEPTSTESANKVSSTPQAYKDWLNANEERIKAAEQRGTLPYFLTDNEKYYKAQPKRPTPLEMAVKRHANRTEEEVESIKLAAWTRQLERYNPSYTEQEKQALAKHWLVLEKELGIKKGRMMSIEEADKQSANPSYYSDKPYRINCATCTPAYLLRLSGFNVTAKPNIKGTMVNKVAKGEWLNTFKNLDGSPIKMTSTREWATSKGYKQMNPSRYKEFYEESCKEVGVYYVSVEWKGGGGHATILQRHPNGVIEYIEPQLDNSSTDRKSLRSLLQQGTHRISSYNGVFRIDNKLFNVEQASIFDK